MGNRNSSGRTSRATAVFTSCCKCRTYSLDGPDVGRGHDGAAVQPTTSGETNELQPVAPRSEESVANQPPTNNTHENLPNSESPEMSRIRLPRPPRRPVGKASIFSLVFFLSFFLKPVVNVLAKESQWCLDVKSEALDGKLWLNWHRVFSSLWALLSYYYFIKGHWHILLLCTCLLMLYRYDAICQSPNALCTH